ncbi:TPA: hypothetical protein ROY26_004963 [Bacillus anthracis]|nr:hypothetical protein [Bacillus anthracis]
MVNTNQPLLMKVCKQQTKPFLYWRNINAEQIVVALSTTYNGAHKNGHDKNRRLST